MKKPVNKKQPKQELKPVKLEVCCPYFDGDNKCCTHPDCIRRIGYECNYSNRIK